MHVWTPHKSKKPNDGERPQQQRSRAPFPVGWASGLGLRGQTAQVRQPMWENSNVNTIRDGDEGRGERGRGPGAG